MLADPSQTVCSIRSLLGIATQPSASSDLGIVKKFIDIKPDGKTDEDAIDLLRRMKSGLVERLSSEGLMWYETRWNGHPLEESQNSHKYYLDKLCEDFVRQMSQMVDEGLKRRTSSFLYTSGQDLGVEILHHASTALVKSRIFCGREQILQYMKTYVQSCEDDRSPLILHGLSGQGKTAVMAVAAKRAIGWIPAGSRPIVVLRFLGTTPSSSDILCALRSMITQLSLALDLPVSDKLEQMNDMRKAFGGLLERIRKKRRKSTVVMLIDSVDQLSKMFGGHRMTWLPRILPPNVYIIVSMLSADAHDCLVNAKKRLGWGSKWIVELPALGDDVMNDVVQLYLSDAQRRLTEQQQQLVLRAIAGCRQPLFVKLVLDQASKWASFTDIGPCDIPTEIHDAISRLFAKLESCYGNVFVSHALAYLTCSRGGLSGIEMEDVLSCDDQVLNEVYCYHDPPLLGTVRLPSLMWARVAEDLREYLAERQVDGKTVLSWYHRQFWEAAEKRYLDSADKLESFHPQLAEIYSQETGLRRTIVLHQRRELVLESADRKITPQPLLTSNLRKLKCLPYHLLLGRAADDLKSKCLVNFRWMLTWLRAEGVNTVLNEYRNMAEEEILEKDSDADLISSFLQLCYDSLYYSPELFAYHVSERIPATRQSPAISQFVRDALEHIHSSTAPRMLPTHTMKFPRITGPLRSAVMVGEDGVLSEDGSKVVCTWTGAFASNQRVQVLSLSTFEVLASIPLQRPSPVVVTRDSQYFVVVCGRTVRLCEADTGDTYRELKHWADSADNLVTARCLSVSHAGNYIAVGVRLAGRPNTDQPRTCSVVTLFGFPDFDRAVSEQTVAGKKVIASMLFTANDSRLVSVSINCVAVFSVPHLDVLNQFQLDTPRLFAATLYQVPQSPLLGIGAGVRGGAKALLFSTLDFSSQWSPLATASDASGTGDEDVELITFGVAFNVESKTLILGTRIKESKAKIGYGKLWIQTGAGTPSQEEWTSCVPLGTGQFKFPCVLLVLPDWRQTLIGWSNGDLGMVDLATSSETWYMHAHVHAINVLSLCCHDECLVTLAADNYLKLWSVRRLVETAESRQRADRPPLPAPPAGNQCNDVTVPGKYSREASCNTSSGEDLASERSEDPPTADQQHLATAHDEPAQTADDDGLQGFPRSYYREASCSSGEDVTSSRRNSPNALLTLSGDLETANQQELTSNVRTATDQLVDETPEPVLGGFPREYFREASFAGVDDLTSDTEEKMTADVIGAIESRISVKPFESQAGALKEGPDNVSDLLIEPQAGGVRTDVVEVRSEEELVISAAEQCVDATVFAQRLVIASHINEEGPKFWYLRNGSLDIQMTSSCDLAYKQSLSDQNITFGGRNHAQLFAFGDHLVYIRKRSTTITPCVIRSSADRDLSVLAHVHLPDAYLCVFLPDTSPDVGPFSMYVVRDGALEQRRADMTLLCSVEIPKLTEDIPNMSSSSGKKKLLSYTAAVTEDRRYFVIVCPTPGGRSGRYLDVVDLLENRYLRRSGLDGRVVWKVLEDAVYYLVRPARCENFELVTARMLAASDGQKYDYCSITESDLQVRSPDRQYGVELDPDHSIHVWSTATPTPRRCCTLIGHVAEVTCISWAGHGAGLLVSGSRDNTVRLWTLVEEGQGRQLCLFHVLGNIDNVHFDLTNEFVVAHCSYAPQRKRAIVLKITNV